MKNLKLGTPDAKLNSLEKKNELAPIRNNVIKIKDFCDKENIPFKKPLLILGTFERV